MPNRKYPKGFTLVEFLVAMAVIAILSAIAVVSYDNARLKGRDARRLSDMDALHTALSLYYDGLGGYPFDQNPREAGLVLGRAGSIVLSNAGFSDQASGAVYMKTVPFNPPGGGTDYVYYSLDRNGYDCDFEPCASFLVAFTLEAPTGGLAAGVYALTPSGISMVSPALASRIAARPAAASLSAKVAMLASSSALFLLDLKKATLDDPAFQKASVAAGTMAKNIALAILIVDSLVLAASALGQVGALFYLALTQPFMLLRKRREYAWGVVYDSQKKLPVDLAIVRLIDEETGRVVQTRVTDKAGRIFFFAPKGSYRIEVAKPGFAFPSAVLAGEREDGKFANLYFGQRFSVAGSGQVINPSVPLDPAGADASDKEFIKRFLRGKMRAAVAVTAIVVSGVALVIAPSPVASIILLFNLALFFVFRRLYSPEPPAEWGVVKDEKTGRAVAHAVVRLFSSPYNRLVETRVADGHGRYNFVVGQNIFYLTASARGYWKTESYPLDMRGLDKPQIISAPIALRRVSETQKIGKRPVDGTPEKR